MKHIVSDPPAEEDYRIRGLALAGLVQYPFHNLWQV